MHGMEHTSDQTSLLVEFERDCERAGVKPTDVLRAAGVHPTLWPKWRDGRVSPTLRSFEAARRALAALSCPPCAA